jgi:SAM-dependent methyltransferase
MAEPDPTERAGTSAALDDPHQAAFVARIYDGEHQGDEADIAWALRLARAAGGLVADLGCGTGRLTLPLADAGFDVLAVDHSPAMLQQLERKLASQPRAVRERVHIDATDLSAWKVTKDRPSLALLGYNTFAALLTADAQRRCLTHIRQMLRPGGLLALATAAIGARVIALPEGFTREVYRRPAPELGSAVELTRRDVHRWTDETRQLRQLAVIYDVQEQDGGRRRHQYEYAVRYTSRWELEHLLARCTFEEVQVCGGYDQEPFTVEGGLFVVTGRRSSKTKPPQ